MELFFFSDAETCAQMAYSMDQRALRPSLSRPLLRYSGLLAGSNQVEDGPPSMERIFHGEAEPDGSNRPPREYVPLYRRAVSSSSSTDAAEEIEMLAMRGRFNDLRGSIEAELRRDLSGGEELQADVDADDDEDEDGQCAINSKVAKAADGDASEPMSPLPSDSNVLHAPPADDVAPQTPGLPQRSPVVEAFHNHEADAIATLSRPSPAIIPLMYRPAPPPTNAGTYSAPGVHPPVSPIVATPARLAQSAADDDDDDVIGMHFACIRESLRGHLGTPRPPPTTPLPPPTPAGTQQLGTGADSAHFMRHAAALSTTGFVPTAALHSSSSPRASGAIPLLAGGGSGAMAGGSAREMGIPSPPPPPPVAAVNWSPFAPTALSDGGRSSSSRPKGAPPVGMVAPSPARRRAIEATLASAPPASPLSSARLANTLLAHQRRYAHERQIHLTEKVAWNRSMPYSPSQGEHAASRARYVQ